METQDLKKIFDNPAPIPGIPDETKFPRFVPSGIPCTEGVLKDHLAKYVQMLLDEGADDAKIVQANDIPQDPRVILKCSHPKCPMYGRSGSCPPHVTGDYQKAKEYVSAYRWAIAYRVNIPKVGIKYFTGPSHIEAIRNKEYKHINASVSRYVFGMGDRVERAAFYDGHYFAVSCHYGPCLYEYCETFNSCQEIENGRCRFPYKARPSVEQFLSIDLIKLGYQVGWENHMFGPCASAQDFPKDYHPYFLGLVLVT